MRMTLIHDLTLRRKVLVRCTAACCLMTAVFASAQTETTPQQFDVVFMERAEAAARTVLSAEMRSPHDNIRWVALRAATELRDPWIAAAAQPMCESTDILEQVLALELITNTDAARGRAQFLTALQSPDRAVRLRGLLGLEKIGDPETTLEIARHLTDDDDPDLRAVAARALGSIGDPAAVPALYSAVGDPHATVRRAAVAALVETGDTDIGRYLVSRLQHGNPSETLPLLRLLTLVRDPLLVPELEPFLRHDLEEARAWAAAAILAALETSHSTAP